MVAPPLLAGAVQVTLPEFTPAVAVPMAGAPGAVLAGACGVTGADGALTALPPPAEFARTWKVYVVPLVSPVMVAEVSVDGAVAVRTKVVPENTRMSNDVTAAPPVGSLNVRNAAPLRASALTIVGVAGGASDTSWNALHTPVTGSVPVQNRRFSTLRTVSTPSTPVVSVTVTVSPLVSMV